MQTAYRWCIYVNDKCPRKKGGKHETYMRGQDETSDLWELSDWGRLVCWQRSAQVTYYHLSNSTDRRGEKRLGKFSVEGCIASQGNQ